MEIDTFTKVIISIFIIGIVLAYLFGNTKNASIKKRNNNEMQFLINKYNRSKDEEFDIYV